MKNFKRMILLCFFSILSFGAFADVTIVGKDSPNDKGEAIDLTITADQATLDQTETIILYRKKATDANFEQVKDLSKATTEYTDKKDVLDETPYIYYADFLNKDKVSVYKSSEFGPFISSPQWFNATKIATLIWTIITITIILMMIKIAKQGKSLYIRPLPGVKAIEDAVGRATEMGKPCIYSPGISVIEDVATLASISILSKVSEIVAEYQSKLIVPNADPVVYAVTDEVVKGAYTKAGRPDAYRSEDIYFMTSRQFAYASGMSGLMARTKPGANFFLGWFMAESLILAESGAMTGAIQIAGTDSISQIPFFIVACDYTLMGEELYAAGAVMGNNPQLLGGLKGQDYVKFLAMLALIVVFLLAMLNVPNASIILTGGN